MFGTERPGAGTAKDPATSKWLDDSRPLIQTILWLSHADRMKIFSENA